MSNTYFAKPGFTTRFSLRFLQKSGVLLVAQIKAYTMIFFYYDKLENFTNL